MFPLRPLSLVLSSVGGRWSNTKDGVFDKMSGTSPREDLIT